MHTIVTSLSANTPRPFRRRIALATAALVAVVGAPLVLATPAHAAPKAAAQAASAAAEDHDAASASESGVVNLNTATEEELGMLPGVGPSKAAAIVAFRKKHGPFKKVDDLNKVKGFGFKTLKKLKPYLTVTGATTYKAKAKKPPTRARGEATSSGSASAAP